MSILVAHSPGAFLDGGGHTCADNVSSEYLVLTVQCVMPVAGRFLTIIKKDEYFHNGIELCDLRVYGQGKVIMSSIL